ncbi:MAG: thiol:disulfide interchange protein DsbA/DsbL [Moraxellaceae bacterium]|nr:thiol:disulfide interchange protein DsbA/DsbL [Moraxellaceae bacterium]
MLKRFLVALVLGLTTVAVQAGEYRTVNKQGRLDKPGMIEVREFFWYGCPHCYKLEPHITAWLARKPADVNFVRTPAALNPVWEHNARGFYAAQMAGVGDNAHEALFQAIHVGRQKLFDQASLTRFYAGFGVDAKNFNNLYNSFAVSGQVGQGKALAQFYGLDGVPAIVVNGKYVLKGEGAVTIATLDELIAKERAALKR